VRLFQDPAARAEAAALLRRDASELSLSALAADGPGWRQRRAASILRAEAAELRSLADTLACLAGSRGATS